jgi:hypothetical protein
METLIAADKAMRKRVEVLIFTLTKSQGQTA